MGGSGELDQIDKMIQLLGTPTDETWPGRRQMPDWGKIALKQVYMGLLFIENQ